MGTTIIQELFSYYRVLSLKHIYQTEQRKRLLAFLQKNPDGQYAIEEIIVHLAGEGAPGKSTVYRLMSKLVEEGRVRRYTKGNGRQFLYQLIDGENCHDHWHLKCIRCGKLIHMDVDTTSFMQQSVRSKHHFFIDGDRTLLFGQCEECISKPH